MSDKEKLTEAFWKTYKGQKISACLGGDCCYFDIEGRFGAFHVSLTAVCSEGYESFLNLYGRRSHVEVSLTRGSVNGVCDLSLWPHRFQDHSGFEVDFDLRELYE
jgi:hypothetical protein